MAPATVPDKRNLAAIERTRSYFFGRIESLYTNVRQIKERTSRPT